MKDKLKKMFPFLSTIRRWERIMIMKIKMFLAKEKLAKYCDDELLPYKICEVRNKLINPNSGYDIKYQYNKVHNLKITSKTMNHLLILPGETFSFNYLMSKAHKYGKYLDGLVLIDKKIVPKKGGGICALSNILYYAFLHTHLTIIERHHHRIQSLAPVNASSLRGIDATISMGLLDLRVRNDTNKIYQIDISFTEEDIIVKILSNKDTVDDIKIYNEDLEYLKKNDKTYERVKVMKKSTNKLNKREKVELLYEEEVEIDYKLPEKIKIKESI